MKIRTLIISTALLALSSLTALAQNTVTGKVVDENGEALVQAAVVANGTSVGVVTDVDGNYSITLPKGASELTFSYVGMEDQTVAVGGKRVVNVTLYQDSKFLEEVVVVGYGTQKKAHLTGSVVAVGSNELAKTTVANVSQALVGKLPGLITQQSVGQPGSDAVSILVRGYSSYNDAGTVLVLVDGVERDMNSLNPADIESISVLKDAAASSVYGMKAANGVILVTTKHGSKGSAQVNYNGKVVFSNPTAYPQMMTGTEYMQYYNLAYALDGNTTPFFSAEAIAATFNGDLSDGLENTNWTEPFFRTTLMHQHNVSVNGGNDRVKYFVSGSYQNQEGFIKNNTNTRYNFRTNVDVKATKDLSVTMGIGISNQNYYQPGSLSYANATVGGTLPFALTTALPFVPKEIDGIATSPMRTADAFVANGEYSAENSGFSAADTFNSQMSAKIEYSLPFLKGLKLSVFTSWDWKEQHSKTFAYAYYLNAIVFANVNTLDPSQMYSYRKCSNGLDEGNLYEGTTRTQRWLLRPQISYNNKFGDHDLGVLFLYEMNNYTSHTFYGSKQDFPLLDIPEMSYATVVTKPETIGGASGLSRYAGFVGRVNYAYADKYLVEIAGRYDGSYKFKKGYRWGLFPSASIGWVMSKEDFFHKALPNVDMFKIRASIGEVGNDVISAYLWRKNYAQSQNATAFGGSTQSSLYNTVSYPNPELTWERIRTYDVGFDYSAWKGLLSVEFDWFYKYTYRILTSINSQYAPSLGGHNPTSMNQGEFDNRGFELILRHQHRVGDFAYNIGANLTWARNRIVSRTEAENTLPWQSCIGQPYGAIMGYLSDGLFQSEEEIRQSAIPTGLVAGETVRVGDIKYVDYNGDGTIDPDDMVYIGRGTRPEMMFSLQFDAAWKGLDFSIQFQGGALCNKLLLGSWSNGVSDATPLTKPWYAGYDNAPLYLVQQSWTPENTNAVYPRLTTNTVSYVNNYRVSDFWMRDGSYLRLKNLSIGYTLPQKWTKKAHLSKVRAFFNASNLLTLTDFKYLDPESPNVVTGYYPQQRNFTIGLDLTF